MSLKISPGSFRNAHPDLWESAQTQSKRLWNLQNILLAEFPEYYKQLPDSLEHYLQLRSLFACVEGLWVRLARRYKAFIFDLLLAILLSNFSSTICFAKR